MICEACNKTLKNTEALKCTTCAKVYHHQCLNITPAQFKNNLSVLKKTWLCPPCTNSKRRNKDSTPVRNAHNLPLHDTIEDKSSDEGGEVAASTDNSPVTLQSASTSLRAPAGDQESLPSWYETLEANLTAKLRAMISDEIKVIKLSNEDLLQSVQFMSEKYEEMKEVVNANNSEMARLRKENQDLKSDMVDLTSRVSLLEQHSRECNIEVSCVPEFNNENITTTLLQLGSSVSFRLEEKDILMSKRVAKIDPKTSRPRSIIAKLGTTALRDGLLAAVAKFNKDNSKDKLSSSHLGIAGEKTAIFVSEHLSPTAKNLHAAARKASKDKGYQFVWVRNGRVLVRKDKDAQALQIRVLSDISKM